VSNFAAVVEHDAHALLFGLLFLADFCVIANDAHTAEFVRIPAGADRITSLVGRHSFFSSSFCRFFSCIATTAARAMTPACILFEARSEGT